MALYWPTPGFKGRTFKLCVLIRWDFNFCILSSPLWGLELDGVTEEIWMQRKKWVCSPPGGDFCMLLSWSLIPQPFCEDVPVFMQPVFSCVTSEGRPWMSDVSPLSGISGLSFDSTFLSSLLFSSLVLLLFLSDLFFFCLLVHSPELFPEDSSIFFVRM